MGRYVYLPIPIWPQDTYEISGLLFENFALIRFKLILERVYVVCWLQSNINKDVSGKKSCKSVQAAAIFRAVAN